ncbi:MAG: hypothetical protein ACXABE_13555, partial [Candidatus Thorarchaeota archaeon]
MSKKTTKKSTATKKKAAKKKPAAKKTTTKKAPAKKATAAAKKPTTKKQPAKEPAVSAAIVKHMEKRFHKMREERRRPPSVMEELVTKVTSLEITKKEFDSICDNVIESYERSLV